MSLCDNRSCKVCGTDPHITIGSFRTFELFTIRAMQIDHRKLLCVGHCYKIFITMLPQKIPANRNSERSKSEDHS